MTPSATHPRSRVPWALALAVGLSSGLAGYVIHAAQVRRVAKPIVQVQRLTNLPGVEESPAISPDGKMLAFVALSGGKKQVWIQSISGGMARAITQDDTDHYAPRWAPDSGSLIYYSPGTIWQMPVEGGMPRQVEEALSPGDLSHDGRNLAALWSREGEVELIVTARDGSDPQSVAKLGGRGMFSNLRWSPDDKKLAFLKKENRQTSVMVVSASGGEAVQAAGGDVTVQGFTWAPDNSGLMVSTHGELWFIPRAERGSPSQLTFGELSYESPDINAGGNLVVSRRGLYTEGEADIVMFTGLKW